MRDAFAVLFFVSVGMVIDPSFLVEEVGRLVAVVAVVAVAKGLVALALVRLLGGPVETGLTVAAGLSQIGELSFILAGMGLELGLLPEEGQNLILAGALVSITLNPLLFRAIAPLSERFRGGSQMSAVEGRSASVP